MTQYTAANVHIMPAENGVIVHLATWDAQMTFVFPDVPQACEFIRKQVTIKQISRPFHDGVGALGQTSEAPGRIERVNRP